MLIVNRNALKKAEDLYFECMTCGAELYVQIDEENDTIGIETCESCLMSCDETSYENGYEEGHREGYAEGHQEGTDEGYGSGHEDGYSEGYDEGFKEGQEALDD